MSKKMKSKKTNTKNNSNKNLSPNSKVITTNNFIKEKAEKNINQENIAKSNLKTKENSNKNIQEKNTKKEKNHNKITLLLSLILIFGGIAISLYPNVSNYFA